MKTKILITIFIFAASLILSGCGGGDSAVPAQKIEITAACVSNPAQSDIESYITLQSGDIIQKVDENTTVGIYHDVDNVKKVCLVSGEADIIRN